MLLGEHSVCSEAWSRVTVRDKHVAKRSCCTVNVWQFLSSLQEKGIKLETEISYLNKMLCHPFYFIFGSFWQNTQLMAMTEEKYPLAQCYCVVCTPQPLLSEITQFRALPCDFSLKHTLLTIHFVSDCIAADDKQMDLGHWMNMRKLLEHGMVHIPIQLPQASVLLKSC